MNSFNDLVREYNAGMMSIHELRAFIDDLSAQMNWLDTILPETTRVTDCGDYRLLVVPWDGP
jgi:hypothetical protein